MTAERYAYPFVIGQLLIYIFSGIVETLGIPYVARPYVILSSIHAFFFLPYLFHVFSEFLIQASFKLSLASIYFFVHPLLVLICHALGTRQFPEGANGLSYLYSSVSWTLSGITLIVATTRWTTRETERFLGVLWKIGLFIAGEALVVFYFFHATPLFYLGTSKTGRFQSVFVNSNYFCGYLGFLLYGLSLYRIIKSSTHSLNRLAMVLGSLLIVASLERSVILGFIVFNAIVIVLYLIRGWRLERPEKKVVHGLLLTILLLLFSSVTIGAMTIFRATSFRESQSILDRIMMGTRGTEVALQYFPLGVGGGLSGIYATSSDVVKPTLSNKLLKSASKRFTQGLSVTYTVLEGHYGTRRSVHSTHFDLFAEFGLFGLAVALLLVFYPMVLLLRLGKYLSFSRDPNLLAGAIFAGFLLSLQFPIIAVSGGSAMIWITLLLYLFSYQSHYVQMKGIKNEP